MAEPRITREELEQYERENEERLKCSRRADALKKRLEPIAEKINEIVRIGGGPDKTCVRQGFKLAHIKGNQSHVPWAKVYAADHTVDEVEAVKAKYPPGDVLVVERIAEA